MSVALSEHLPLLATAQDGTQKLRGLILELAVRGKLVPQDSISDKESWKRGLFSDFFSLEYGDNLPAPKRTGTGEYPVYGSNGVVGTHNECRVKAPCIVVGRKGSAGALNLCRETGCWVTDVAYYCIPPSGIDLDFAFALFHTLGLDNLGKGIKPGLSRNEAYSLPVAIPSVAEQHRIVAKVDELMALCDRLEAEHSDAATAHERLVATLLGTLTQSADATDLAANWQRLADHFDTLFTTESSLDALKQTILQLAVMGKLVPQDPNDEPASNFLKLIAQDRARRVEGKTKKLDPLPPVGEDKRPFVLPAGWEWIPFGNATICRDGERVPVSQDERNQRERLYDYYGASGVIDKIDGYLFDKPLLLIGEDGANLVNRSTPIAFIARGKYWVNNHAHVIDGLSESYLRFLTLFINAIDLKPYVTGTAQPKMNQAKMNSIPLALPPEAEQHRIVAKVDELLALVDRLKAGITESRTRQAQLADTLIETALKAT
ncbi:restriction endonuclease subunit S [Dechloromonas sp. H13]|uniref:restriction endonuclease subunit S n=1 Tax=Dechloromonas sp. H13 TaxID=2570193 RepID=UPI001D184F79|nr:restriction endonuclease subunit S [Dechloromonas sp. H13]